MRWPWVSRVMHDQVVKALSERVGMEQQGRSALAHQRNDLMVQIAGERDRYDALVQQIVSMKRDGFQIVHPPVQREPMPPRAADEAINDRAGANAPLRRHLIDYANQQRRKNVPEEQIADKVLNWQSEGDED